MAIILSVLVLALIFSVIPAALAADDSATVGGASHEDVRDNVVPEFHDVQLVTVQLAADGDRVPASYPIPSATDAVDGPVAVTCDPGQDTLLGHGIHEVTCMASDRSGNTTSTFIFVLVSDTEPLEYEFSHFGMAYAGKDYIHIAFNPVPNQTYKCILLENPGRNSDRVRNQLCSYDLRTSGDRSDLLEPDTTYRISLAYIKTRPLLIEPVNITTSSVIEPLVINVSPIVKEATGKLTPIPVTYDNVTGGVPPYNITNNSPGSFGLGVTDVIWNVTDSAGNTASAIQRVTVRDTTPPVFPDAPQIIPSRINQTNTIPVYDLPIAHDEVDGYITAECNNDDIILKLGINNILCDVEDNLINKASTHVFVFTYNEQSPSRVVFDGGEGLAGPDYVHYTFKPDSSEKYTCNIDSDNNSASRNITNGVPLCSFESLTPNTSYTVGVTSDNGTLVEPVEIMTQSTSLVIIPPPDITAEATGKLTKIDDLGKPIVKGGVPPYNDPQNDAPERFPLGITNVTWSVTDSVGKTASAIQTVTIQDTTPPTFSYIPAFLLVSDENATATNYYPPTANDLVDGTITSQCSPGPDEVLSYGIHTVTCNAADSFGNPANATFYILISDIELERHDIDEIGTVFVGHDIIYLTFANIVDKDGYDCVIWTDNSDEHITTFTKEPLCTYALLEPKTNYIVDVVPKNTSQPLFSSIQVTTTSSPVVLTARDDYIMINEDEPSVISPLENDSYTDAPQPLNQLSQSVKLESYRQTLQGDVIDGVFVAYSEVMPKTKITPKDSIPAISDVREEIREQRGIIQLLRQDRDLTKDALELQRNATRNAQDALQEGRTAYKAGNLAEADFEQLKAERDTQRLLLNEAKQDLVNAKQNLADAKASLKVSKQIRDIIKGKISNIDPRIAGLLDAQDKIPVYIQTFENHTQSALAINYTSYDGQGYNALLYPSEITSLANSAYIQSITLPHLPETSTSQGVNLSLANTLHSMNITGKNITIAVIDDSFILDDPKLSTVTYSAVYDSVGYCGGSISCGKVFGDSHGTATAGIIHDMAPGANLHLYAIASSADFVNAINDVISKGQADVISVSVGFPTLGGDGTTGHFRDGTSTVAKAADLAKTADILVAVAAGNDAKSHWSGTFKKSTITPDRLNLSGYSGLVEFQSDEIGLHNACLPISHGGWTISTWDSWKSTMRDYDMFLFDDMMNRIIYHSGTIQSQVESEPIEIIRGTPRSNACLVMALSNDTAPDTDKIHIYVIRGAIHDGLADAASSISTPADSAGVIAVGAVNHATQTLESFSSSGPTDDGRPKPEMCGFDGVASDVPSFNPYIGTSAAAPHVAGAAVLLMQLHPSANAQHISDILYESATSFDGCGAGIVLLSNQTLSSFDTTDESLTLSQSDSQISTISTHAASSVSIASITQPSHGEASILSGNTTIHYAPNSNYHGADFMTYTISDKHGATDTAIIHITINPINDRPVAVNDHINITETNILDILENDYDIENDTIRIDQLYNVTGGTAQINSDNIVTFVPTASRGSFDYTIIDANNATSDPARVQIVSISDKIGIVETIFYDDFESGLEKWDISRRYIGFNSIGIRQITTPDDPNDSIAATLTCYVVSCYFELAESVNLTKYDDARLSLDVVFNSKYDARILRMDAYDGSSWNKLHTWNSRNSVPVLTPASFDLSDYLVDNFDLKFVFDINPPNNIGSILIDDIKIEGIQYNDMTNSKVTLFGDNPQTVIFGTDYTEFGASAPDGLVVLINSSSIERRVGSYEVRYEAVDSDGKMVDTALRTVNVIDFIPPVLSIVGDDVILHGNQTYVERGATAYDDIDGTIHNIKIDPSGVNFNKPGTYNMLYRATDSSNNTSVAARSIQVLGSDIIYDSIPISSINFIDPNVPLLQDNTLAINDFHYIDDNFRNPEYQVKIFDNHDGKWSQTQMLHTPYSVSTNAFGSAGISGDTMVGFVRTNNPYDQKLYIIEKNNDTWVSNPLPINDYYRSSKIEPTSPIEIDNNTIAAMDAVFSLSLYDPSNIFIQIFDRNSTGGWSKTQHIESELKNSLFNQMFLDGDTLAIARFHNGVDIHVYERNSMGVWNLANTFAYPIGWNHAHIHYSFHPHDLHVEDDLLVAHVKTVDQDTGVWGSTLFIFEREDGVWSLSDRLKIDPPPDRHFAPQNQFAVAANHIFVNLQNDTILSGVSYGRDVAGSIFAHQKDSSGKWIQVGSWIYPLGIRDIASSDDKILFSTGNHPTDPTAFMTSYTGDYMSLLLTNSASEILTAHYNVPSTNNIVNYDVIYEIPVLLNTTTIDVSLDEFGNMFKASVYGIGEQQLLVYLDITNSTAYMMEQPEEVTFGLYGYDGIYTRQTVPIEQIVPVFPFDIEDLTATSISISWAPYAAQYKAVISPVSDPTAKSAVIISGTEHTFTNLEPETDYTISLGVQGYDETQYTMNIGTAMGDLP